MRRWHGKFVIGLTGNIGTGKSVVRRMLEHLGAYGIDADALAHRIVAKGAPGYDAVVQMFGKWILGSDGEIDRVKLGRMVFGDPTALAQLEKITHPYVLQAIDYFIQRSNHHVVVIEAIKLMESGLEKHCHSLWAVYAPVSYTHLRAHETPEHLVCRLLLEKKNFHALRHVFLSPLKDLPTFSCHKQN